MIHRSRPRLIRQVDIRPSIQVLLQRLGVAPFSGDMNGQFRTGFTTVFSKQAGEFLCVGLNRVIQRGLFARGQRVHFRLLSQQHFRLLNSPKRSGVVHRCFAVGIP